LILSNILGLDPVWPACPFLDLLERGRESYGIVGAREIENVFSGEIVTAIRALSWKSSFLKD